MLLRMKVLVVACICVPAVMGFPSSTTTNTDTDDKTPTLPNPSSRSTTNTKREVSGGKWRPVYPSHSSFRVIKVPALFSKTSSFAKLNDIPAETMSRFQAPSSVTKDARLVEYYADMSEVSVPPHVHQLLHKVPFFETLDHAKLITALQERRKYAGLPIHVLKSSRPHFPFFSY